MASPTRSTDRLTPGTFTVVGEVILRGVKMLLVAPASTEVQALMTVPEFDGDLSFETVTLTQTSWKDDTNPLYPVISEAGDLDFVVPEASADPIISLADIFDIDMKLRDDFKTAIFGLVETFKANREDSALPEKPIRDYRPRENIIDYLRSRKVSVPGLKPVL